MKCRSCGLEIAEKAIVCYRCGTPTADTPPVRLTPAGRGPGWPVPLAGVLVVLALCAMVFATPSDTAARWSAWAALIIGTVASGLWVRARTRLRGPRR